MIISAELGLAEGGGAGCGRGGGRSLSPCALHFGSVSARMDVGCMIEI